MRTDMNDSIVAVILQSSHWLQHEGLSKGPTQHLCLASVVQEMSFKEQQRAAIHEIGHVVAARHVGGPFTGQLIKVRPAKGNAHCMGTQSPVL
jgi:hypothetical protein